MGNRGHQSAAEKRGCLLSFTKNRGSRMEEHGQNPEKKRKKKHHNREGGDERGRFSQALGQDCLRVCRT